MSANTTEASRYQQLRGHLAYLKLATAAEALPAVLDTAKTENLSPTATLERLLRIEVQATRLAATSIPPVGPRTSHARPGSCAQAGRPQRKPG